jgi:hypothetical protein
MRKDIDNWVSQNKGDARIGSTTRKAEEIVRQSFNTILLKECVAPLRDIVKDVLVAVEMTINTLRSSGPISYKVLCDVFETAKGGYEECNLLPSVYDPFENIFLNLIDHLILRLREEMESAV